MPKCKNDDKSFYTGKEPSPKGKGFSAKKTPIGTKKRGKDGKLWIVKKRIDGVKLWTKIPNKKKVSKKKVIKKKVTKKKVTKKTKYIMKGGNSIQTIDSNTSAFCNGINIQWFLNNNETLLTKGGKRGINVLIKNDDDMTKFTESATILAPEDEGFMNLLEQVVSSPEYKPHIGDATDRFKLIQRLIYNRPLVFYLDTNNSLGMIRPGNVDALDHVAGRFDPYIDGKDEKKYHLISLAALMGCWSLTPIINSGIKNSNENKRLLREQKFFNGEPKKGNYNTEAYVCGLVGARFEKPNQMEDAYIRDEENQTNIIHQRLRELFKSKIELNNGKYKHTYRNQKPINKYNLYRERIRMTLELFFKQCYNISTKKDELLFPIITGIGAGEWVKGSGMPVNVINDIIEDCVLSIIEDNEDYRTTFSLGIRFSSLTNNTGDVPPRQIPIYSDIKPRAILPSNAFIKKYVDHYSWLDKYPVYHTHWLTGSPQTFFSENELYDQFGKVNVKQALLFAWDGNSFVGNEYWGGNMIGSQDPVTVSSCCIAQLCNPFINQVMIRKINYVSEEEEEPEPEPEPAQNDDSNIPLVVHIKCI